MTVHRNDIHAKKVDQWMAENAMGLSAANLLQLFEFTLTKIEGRSLATLSAVTVSVVVDRVLHESKEKFPLLQEMKIGPHGFDFAASRTRLNQGPVTELRAALRHLLVEFLSVLGNITAEILTNSLHQELLQVTCENALDTSELQNMRTRRSVKTNREDL